MSESPGRSDGKPKHLLEDLFIILCILSLWPTILGWDGPFYDLFLYGALAGLLVIFYRRMKRFRQARDELNRK
jgi:hypothetical protein